MPFIAAHMLPDSSGAAAHFRCLVDLDLPCNLRCARCPRASRGRRLDEALAGAVFGRIAEQIVASGQRHVAVAFFGGEPLGSSQLLPQLGLLKARLDRERVAHRFALVTNGTLLTRSVAARLSAAGLSRVLVTLCGCRPHHDERRRTAGGAPTYERILANLVEARRHLEVHVRYELGGLAALTCLPLLIADLLRRECLSGPDCLRVSLQGPSSYAAQARSLIGPGWPPGEIAGAPPGNLA